MRPTGNLFAIRQGTRNHRMSRMMSSSLMGYIFSIKSGTKVNHGLDGALVRIRFWLVKLDADYKRHHRSDQTTAVLFCAFGMSF